MITLMMGKRNLQQESGCACITDCSPFPVIPFVVLVRRSHPWFPAGDIVLSSAKTMEPDGAAAEGEVSDRLPTEDEAGPAAGASSADVGRSSSADGTRAITTPDQTRSHQPDAIQGQPPFTAGESSPPSPARQLKRASSETNLRHVERVAWDSAKTDVENVMEQLASARFNTMRTFRQHDSDGSHGIARDEFKQALGVRGLGVCGADGKLLREELAAEAFEALDQDGDGMITLLEIERNLRFRTEIGAATQMQAVQRGKVVRGDLRRSMTSNITFGAGASLGPGGSRAPQGAEHLAGTDVAAATDGATSVPATPPSVPATPPSRGPSRGQASTGPSTGPAAGLGGVMTALKAGPAKGLAHKDKSRGAPFPLPMAPKASGDSPTSTAMAQIKTLARFNAMGGDQAKPNVAAPYVWDPSKTPVENVKEQLATARLDTMRVFRRCDVDNNGSISRKEFSGLSGSLGILGENGEKLTPELLDTVFLTLDVNGDGSLTFAEIEKTLRFRTETGAAAELQAITRGRSTRNIIDAERSSEAEKVVDMLTKNREPTLKILKKVSSTPRVISKLEFREGVPRVCELVVPYGNWREFLKKVRDRDLDTIFVTLGGDTKAGLRFKDIDEYLKKRAAEIAAEKARIRAEEKAVREAEEARLEREAYEASSQSPSQISLTLTISLTITISLTKSSLPSPSPSPITRHHNRHPSPVTIAIAIAIAIALTITITIPITITITITIPTTVTVTITTTRHPAPLTPPHPLLHRLHRLGSLESLGENV